MTKHTFTTSAGLEISFTPPSANQIELAEEGLREEFRERGEPFEPPTYEVPIGDGPHTQNFEHNESTLTTDEDKARWKAYQEGLAHLTFEIGKVRQEFCFEAINVNLPEDTSWMDRQRKKHIKIPTDPDELKLHYIRTEILRTMADIMEAVARVVTSAYAGATTEEEEQAASNLFRNRLQKATLEAANKTPRPAKVKRARAKRRVDPQ